MPQTSGSGVEALELGAVGRRGPGNSSTCYNQGRSPKKFWGALGEYWRGFGPSPLEPPPLKDIIVIKLHNSEPHKV